MIKFLFALLLISTILESGVVVSTEEEFQLSPEQKYTLNRTIYDQYYSSIPSNPNVYEEIPIFSDMELSQVSGYLEPNMVFTIKDIFINEQSSPIFQLTDDSYVLAHTNLIYDDKVLSNRKVHQFKWTLGSTEVYSQPYVNGVQKIEYSNLDYKEVELVEISKTLHGSYGKIEGIGWVEIKKISDLDTRIEKVQDLLNRKYNNDGLSIYVKQLSTNKVAGINQDVEVYTASVAKLPILFYIQEEIDKGNISLSTFVNYTEEVNGFSSAYEVEGSGILPKKANNNSYKIGDLLEWTAKYSDNVASNILSYYVTHQFDADYRMKIASVIGREWDMKSRNASAKMAGQIMELIYQQNGIVIKALSNTDFDGERIPRDIDVPVAHKIGDAYDYRHDVALVYAESPFILSILTNKSSYDIISTIASDVYEVLK